MSNTMPEFCFLKMVNTSPPWKEWMRKNLHNWPERLYKEVCAADAQSAFASVTNKCSEEVMTERTFIAGFIFSSLLAAISNNRVTQL